MIDASGLLCHVISTVTLHTVKADSTCFSYQQSLVRHAVCCGCSPQAPPHPLLPLLNPNSSTSAFSSCTPETSSASPPTLCHFTFLLTPSLLASVRPPFQQGAREAGRWRAATGPPKPQASHSVRGGVLSALHTPWCPPPPPARVLVSRNSH